MLMRTSITVLLLAASTAAFAGDCDSIRDKKRRLNCDSGQRDAQAYREEADAWNKLADARDTVCIIERVAVRGLPLQQRRVYVTTRVAANLLSRGASRC